MNVTELRIYRTYEWVGEKKPIELVRFGDKANLVLEATDTLQYRGLYSDDWINVKIEEAEKPRAPVDKSNGFSRSLNIRDSFVEAAFNKARGQEK